MSVINNNMLNWIKIAVAALAIVILLWALQPDLGFATDAQDKSTDTQNNSGEENKVSNTDYQYFTIGDIQDLTSSYDYSY
jgi:hypothetical protein